jgi:hypothetical protein
MHLDLSNHLDLGFKGQVLSFEVEEHIPAQYEQIFIDTIVLHCNSILILSWAIIGQFGVGHVNCRSQEYIIDQIEQRGLKYNKEDTLFIRNAEYKNAPWFKNTLMVFRK